MKSIFAVLIRMLSTASSVAQSQSLAGSGLPSVAIPKTTAVLVIEIPKEGVTFHKPSPSCRKRPEQL